MASVVLPAPVRLAVRCSARATQPAIPRTVRDRPATLGFLACPGSHDLLQAPADSSVLVLDLFQFAYLVEARLEAVKQQVVFEVRVRFEGRVEDSGHRFNLAGGPGGRHRLFEMVELCVEHRVLSDEGIGVPEAERPHVFNRFHRLNSRQVRQMKGVGLGLYIARTIIRAHGGRIWVDAAPGGGAIFSFSLPRQHKAPVPILFGRG